MRYLLYSLLLILVAFQFSCGGGGETKSKDLSGLEGIWYVKTTGGGVEGTGPDGEPYSENFATDPYEGKIGITTNQIFLIDAGDVGEPDPAVDKWQYNGDTLYVEYTEDWEDEDGDWYKSGTNCGVVPFTAKIKISAAVTEGSNAGIFTGTWVCNWTSPACGSGGYDGEAQGTLTKEP